MRVSIITVCFNSENTIRQTIESIINQSYKDIEYIIIDGGSTDNTMNIVADYHDGINYCVSEKDSGIYDAMNKGIRASTGDIVGIVNSDDWLETDAVSSVVKCFIDTEADLVHGQIRSIGGYDNGKICGSSLGDGNVWISMPICHPAAFVKRDVYERIGLYSTEYRIISDYEFICRCYLRNVRFQYLETILSNFRSDGISSRNPLLCAKEELKMIQQYKEEIINYNGVYKYHLNKVKRAKLRELLEDRSDSPIKSLENHLNSERQIILWGIGKWGKRIIDYMLDMDIEPEFIIDRNAVGGVYKGIKIVQPETVCNETIPILIAIVDFAKEEIPVNMKDCRFMTIDEWADETDEADS